MFGFGKKDKEVKFSPETEAAIRKILAEANAPGPGPVPEVPRVGPALPAIPHEHPVMSPATLPVQAPVRVPAPEPVRPIEVSAVAPKKKFHGKEFMQKAVVFVAVVLFVGFIGLGLFALAMMMQANITAAVMYYIIGVYLEAGIIVALLLFIILLYGWLKPVWSYKDVRNKAGKAWMFVVHKTGQITAEPARYISEVFETESKPRSGKDPLAFFKNDRVNTHLGTATVGVFYDGVGIAANPEFALACEYLREKGYATIDDARTAWEAGTLKINIPLFKEIDFSALSDYISTKPATLRAYTDTKVNLARLEQNQKFWENPQVMAFGFIIICACFGLGIAKSMGVF